MKVMLINPNSILAKNSKVYNRSVSPVLPLGIAYIAAILEKNGIDVKIIDQYANKIGNAELIKKIKLISPQIVGFSCLTSAMGNVKLLIKQIKNLNQNTKIVLGNIHATVFANNLLKEEMTDIVVRGEGEFSMLETVLALKDKNDLRNIKGISFTEDGKIYNNPDREPVDDLNKLPYPAWHLFELKHYKRNPLLGTYGIVLPIQASRGCHYQCIFCSQDKIHKKPRYRYINNIIDEIEYMNKRFKIFYFGFNDANFPSSNMQGLEFCDKLIERGLHKKIKWITETRVDLINLELLKRMKEAGLHLIMYGFESGNQNILDSLKKMTTLDQARKAMEYTKKVKVSALGLFILGMPGESVETCEETIKFARELDCDIAKFNIAVPFPGSEFFEKWNKDKLRAAGWEDKFTSWPDWSSNSGNLIYTPEGMTGRELIDLQRKAMFKFYVRPKLIIKHIIKRRFTLSDMCYGAHILVSNRLKSLFSVG